MIKQRPLKGHFEKDDLVTVYVPQTMDDPKNGVVVAFRACSDGSYQYWVHFPDTDDTAIYHESWVSAQTQELNEFTCSGCGDFFYSGRDEVTFCPTCGDENTAEKTGHTVEFE